MGRKGGGPVGLIADFGVRPLVVVGGGDDGDAMRMRELGQRLERGNDLLAAGHIELPVSAHEVVQRIDIPEDQTRHAGSHPDECRLHPVRRPPL